MMLARMSPCPRRHLLSMMMISSFSSSSYHHWRRMVSLLRLCTKKVAWLGVEFEWVTSE